ncbi:2TM domain-containing protein [Methanogenium cariaci]|uniref:2TM domain-containing protein n=1 Tax=Methanogenium cariaci TaxID=2197 RepID=UPI000781799B|nr:2TM domain-containing protein [Methanogenium cariaci]
MEDEAYRRAKAHVQEVRGGFYTHFATYIFINLLLFAVNAVTSWGGNWWFYWVTLFWGGIGIVIHAASVWGGSRHFLGKEWEEKKIQTILEKENR